jgi:hypothetical protein
MAHRACAALAAPASALARVEPSPLPPAWGGRQSFSSPCGMEASPGVLPSLDCATPDRMWPLATVSLMRLAFGYPGNVHYIHNVHQFRSQADRFIFPVAETPVNDCGGPGSRRVSLSPHSPPLGSAYPIENNMVFLARFARSLFSSPDSQRRGS